MDPVSTLNQTGESFNVGELCSTLDGQSRAILDVERQFWRTAEAKETAIRELGLSPIRYYQLLVALMRSPAALAADPVTVKRLLRLAERRRGI